MGYALLNVPGASRTSDAFRQAFGAMVDVHGWDGDAIAAVISNESGFNPAAMNPLPGQSAVGLLQFIRSTLAALGWLGTREQFAALSDVQQLPFVERYYLNAVDPGAHRPVDYYLATWGAPPGLPDDHVLAAAGSVVYELNKSLDTNRDGVITVADLGAVVDAKIRRAGGARLGAGKAPPEMLRASRSSRSYSSRPSPSGARARAHAGANR
jgi:hypothetical protein